jgi:hypothetical protein
VVAACGAGAARQLKYFLYLCVMKNKAIKVRTLKKYYKLLGGFFIDAAKIIFGSIMVMPIVEEEFLFIVRG